MGRPHLAIPASDYSERREEVRAVLENYGTVELLNDDGSVRMGFSCPAPEVTDSAISYSLRVAAKLRSYLEKMGHHDLIEEAEESAKEEVSRG